jgi:LacI family transcriptional regulator
MEYGKPAPNMRDVAREAGVSVATVSFILNGTRKVRPETERRVMAAVHNLGYSRNALARHLALGRSHLLGVIVSDLRNPFFPEITTGFQDAANLREMEAIVMNTNYDVQRTWSAVRRLLDLQVPGVACLTSQIDPAIQDLLVRKGVCAVYLDLGRVDRYVSNIAVDYEHGIGAALDHVRRLGHSRIGFIGGNPNLPSAQRRKRAFLAGAVKMGGLETSVVDSDFTANGGYLACSKLLARFPATAIIAANDLMAIGAMHLAYDRGIRVPRDLSVMGFDDILFAQSTQPPLSTVSIPRSELGKVAFQALWTMIGDSGRSGREYRVETSLVVRDSTARVGGG